MRHKIQSNLTYTQQRRGKDRSVFSSSFLCVKKVTWELLLHLYGGLRDDRNEAELNAGVGLRTEVINDRTQRIYTAAHGRARPPRTAPWNGGAWCRDKSQEGAGPLSPVLARHISDPRP